MGERRLERRILHKVKDTTEPLNLESSGLDNGRIVLRISILGTGYVGLVTGACLADFGHSVTCVDTDIEKINALDNGQIPIYEPGLEEIVFKNVKDSRLDFTSDLAIPISQSDVVFIAVGTPMREQDGAADLRNVYRAAAQIAKHITGYTVIAVKSTVPVGTGDEVERIIGDVSPTADFSIASNPEFLREGSAIHDFKLPDRILTGVEDDRAKKVLQEVYRPLFLNEAPIMVTSRRSSELIKYAANAFLAMKITFINELADLSEELGTNVQEVALGIGLDNRVGTKFLNAGPGYGGSCFPKDTAALLSLAQNVGIPLRLVEATVAANEQRKRNMGRKVLSACGGDVRGKRIGVLGLTFKPNTDDVREAPSIDIVRFLQDKGAAIQAFDPEGMKSFEMLSDGANFVQDPYAAASGADALVIATEWEIFRALDLARLKAVMRMPVLIDLRNIYHRVEVERHGFKYECVGRPSEPSKFERSRAAE